MTHIHKTALVPYSIDNMFNLVNDIESYPKFLPWCKQATLLSRNDTDVIASITMGSVALEKTFTTTNTIKTNEFIEMRLLEGPFSHLKGAWHFHPIGNEGCKISLDMHFEISNKILRISLGPIFTKIINNLMDAFIQRAGELYGHD